LHWKATDKLRILPIEFDLQRQNFKKHVAGGAAQVIEFLPIQREALSSNSSTAKINK
jgi:hypothetical protein